ncbi:S1C family serine protease [Streptomyces albus]|uniref:S1C family serine protease n=1 Tax=Streptomyces albus TaxID=1888 RepID=UPI00373AECD3
MPAAEPPVPGPAPTPPGPGAEQPAGEPRHAADPYGTPPYGTPGPWAPAPPVQRPAVTPARGTVLPPDAPLPAPPAGTGAGDGSGERLTASVPPPCPQPAPAASLAPPQGPQAPPATAVQPGRSEEPGAAADRPLPAATTGPDAGTAPVTAAPISPATGGAAPAGPTSAGPAAASGGSAAEGSAPAAGPAPAAAPAGLPAPAGPVAHTAPGEAEPSPASAAADGASSTPPPLPVPAPAPWPAPAGSGTAAGMPSVPSAPGAGGHWERYDPWAAPGAPAPGALPAPGGPLPAVRRRGRSRGALVAGALLLTLVAGAIGGGVGAYIERNGGVVDVALPQAPAEDRPRDPGSVAGIAEAALPGVVTFHVKGGGKEGTGTGFVLDRRGHILTNNHVVEAAASGGDISVTFSGGATAEAEIVGRDSGYDLAVVRVSGVRGLRPLRLGNSDSVRVGDPVVAIGAPYDLAGTVTSGIISAKERPITAGGGKDGGSDVSYVDAIQTDAPINPGNSGGPLMDMEGRVIGINSAIRAADDETGLGASQGGSIGLGFAIPVNQGKRVAEELINTGRATHPVIGVTLDMRFTGDGAKVGADDGDRPAVTPDGPGDKAGIKPGDVITAVNGARVHNGEELIVKIRAHRPGDRLELTLKRDGRERTLRLTLGSASDEE